MRPNPLAPWELRIGDLRVYYDIHDTHVVEDKPEPRVLVLAVGIKDRNRLIIGGEEVKL
jgi:hypothetical protein